MVSSRLKNVLKNAMTSVGMLFLIFKGQAAFAQLPWETTLETISQSVSGPLLLSISTIMVVVTCLMLAFGEWGDGFKRLLNMAMWLSMAFGVASFIGIMSGS